MRRPLPILVLLLSATLVTSGCITSTTLVKLKPNGSGTLEATVLVNTALFKDLGQIFGGEMRSTGGSQLPRPEELAKQLSQLKGVRLVSNTPVKEGDMEGARVVAAFDDVNQISVSDGLPAGSAKPGPGDKVTFALARQPGGTSLLTIAFPDTPGRTGEPEPPKRETQNQPRSRQREGGATAKPDPEMTKMIAGFFKGMRVMVAVDIDGNLVRSSSPWVEGNRVTLLEIDMDRLLEDPAALERLDSLPLGPDLSMAKAREAMEKAGVKGLKVNDPTITIEFK